MKNKNLIIILMMLTITFTIIGGSLAYYNWQTSEQERTNVSFTAEANFSCSADVGGTISSNDNYLMPDNCTGTHAIKRILTTSPKITGTKNIYMDLWLDINEISSGLSNSNNFKYVLTTSSTSCTTGVVSSGTFTGKTEGNKISLLSSKNYSQTITDTYYLYIWLDSAETSTDTQSQSFSLSLNGECSDTLFTTAETLIDNANPESLSYNNATAEQKTNMWTFHHNATVQTEALTDYRYIGSSPNNYLEFNNEVWRIIGVFEGRIKIIKEERVRKIKFDHKQTGVGTAKTNFGSSDWLDAQLMYMLNPTTFTLKSGYIYENNLIKDTSGNIIYQIGCLPESIAAGGTYTCTACTWSLTQTALSQIDKFTYYLGASNVDTGQGAESYYNFERGNTVYTGRDISWYGLVAMPYASDYAYTFAKGVDDTCYSDTYNCASGTPSSSWMFKNINIWLSTAYIGGDYIYVILSSGRIEHFNVSNDMSLRPVVYLKQGTKLTGTGTSTDMYKIS